MNSLAIPVPRLRPGRAPMAVDRSIGASAGLILTAIVVLWGLALPFGFIFSLRCLTVLSFAVAVLGLPRPGIALFGASMLCGLDPLARHYLFTGGALRWNTINYWFLLVGVVFFRTWISSPVAPLRAMGLLILWLAIGLLPSSDPREGTQHLLELTSALGLYAYWSRVADLRQTIPWQGLIMGVLSGLGGVLYYVADDLPRRLNENAYCHFHLTALFCISIAIPFTAKSLWRRVALVALFSFNMILVVLSASRGGTVLGIICCLYVLYELRKQRVLMVLMALGIALAALGTEGLQAQREKALKKWNTLVGADRDMANRTSGRSQLLLAGWLMFQKHPLGVGTGGFLDAAADIDNLEVQAYAHGHKVNAHAGVLKILAENGFIGFFILLAFLSSFAFATFSSTPSMRALGIFTSVALGFALTVTEFQSRDIWLLGASASAFMARFRRRPSPRASGSQRSARVPSRQLGPSGIPPSQPPAMLDGRPGLALNPIDRRQSGDSRGQ